MDEVTERFTAASPWDVVDKTGQSSNLRVWQETDPVTGEEIVHMTFSVRPNGQLGIYENLDENNKVSSIVICSSGGARLAPGLDDGTIRLNVTAFRKPGDKKAGKSGNRRLLSGPVGPQRPAGPAVRVPPTPQGKR